MLGPELQGEWSLYISGFTLGTIALGFGLSPAIHHYVAAGKIEKKTLVSQLFFFVILVTVIFFLVLLMIQGRQLEKVFLPQAGNKILLLIGLGFSLMLIIFNELMASILLAESQFTRKAKIIGFSSIILLGVYTVLYFFIPHESLSHFQYLIVFNLIVLFGQSFFLVFYVLKQDEYTLSYRFLDKKLFALLISFALLAYTANFVQFLNYKMDVWFINAYVLDESKLGIYTVAVSLAQLIWLVPIAFHTVIFTEVSQNKDINPKGKIRIWSFWVLLFAFAAAFVGYFISYLLVPLFLGEKYLYIIKVLPLILPGIVLFAPSILWSAYLAGINRIDVNLKASLIGFCVALLGDFLIIREHGILGAAIVTSFSYTITSLTTYIYFNKLN